LRKQLNLETSGTRKGIVAKMTHSYLTCGKNLKDCRWCRLKAEKLSLKHGFDIQEVDYAVTFAENPVVSLMDSEKAEAEYQKFKAQYEPTAEEIKMMEEELYQKLVQDCKKIVAREHEDIVRRRHELGVRIVEDEDKYVKHKWGSGTFIKKLAFDIQVEPSTVYCSIRFAEKYPDVEKFLTSHKLPQAKALTWHYIVHNLLYESKPKPPLKPKLESPVAKPPVTETQPLSYLKPLSFIDEVPSVNESTFDIMTIMDELERIADKTRMQPLTKVYFTGASWQLHLDIRHYNSSQETEPCTMPERARITRSFKRETDG